jgi:archaellum biogenesis protein FlaJ (TadC family)
MNNGILRESKMSSFGAKVVATGALALLGLFVLKFVLGFFGAIFAIMMFVLLKVVPIVLIAMVVIWLFRKLTRKDRTVTTTT